MFKNEDIKVWTKMHKIIFFSIFFLIFLSFGSFAATIKGSVYDLELDKMNDVVVRIDSNPKQIFVSKDGMYGFEVAQGKYIITARQDEKDLFAKENITVVKDGAFIVDLILFSSLEEEEFLFNETEEDEKEKSASSFNYIALAILILIIILFFIRMESKKSESKTESVQNQQTADSKPKTANQLDDLARQILDFIKNEQGRVTQKEIREQFPLSEAKISLIIAELEEKGFVKKIKRGRGNIVVLNK